MGNKVWDVINILRGSYSSSSYVELLGGFAFVKAVSEKYNLEFDYDNMTFKNTSKTDFNEIEISIMKDLNVLFINSIDKEIYNQIMPLIKDVSNTELASSLFENYSKMDNNTTPESLAKLALKILDLKENDSILDLCSGYGLFLTEAFKIKKSIKIHGREINKVSAMISKIILYLNNIETADIQTQDVLLNSESSRFDKIFSHFPFIMRLDRNKIDKINKSGELNFEYDFDTRTSSDWIFVTKTINSLKDNGKAVVIMADGPLYKSQDAEFRKELINSGYVEAIIQLPERLLFNTIISITMLVLSKDDKRNKVKIIDASESFTKGRRFNELTEENIKSILNMYNSEEHFINIKEIKENHYLLSPKRYTNQIDIENPIKVKEFSHTIFRGVQLSAKQLDKGFVDAQTYDYKVLNLSDINDNTIDYKGLQKVKLEGNKWDKYLLKDKDFIISAKGATIKTSIVEISETDKILASGNLMVIRINQEIVNPYYVKVFLDSPLGRKVINSVQTGSVFISIGKKMLEEMEIPFVDLDKQNEVATKFLAYLDELKYYQRKLDNVDNKIANLFEDEMGGE